MFSYQMNDQTGTPEVLTIHTVQDEEVPGSLSSVASPRTLLKSSILDVKDLKIGFHEIAFINDWHAIQVKFRDSLGLIQVGYVKVFPLR